MNIQASPYTQLFWNEFLLAPESYTYNMCIDQTIFGDLDILRLEQAIKLFTQEHLLHSARLEERKGELVWQKMICPPKNFLYIFSSRKELIDYIHTPFDLKKGHLCQGGLYKVVENHYEFVFKGHHILYDGVSTDELYEKISYFYNNPFISLKKAGDTEDIILKFQLFHSRVKELKEQYNADKFWANMLKGFSAKNELPYLPHSKELQEQDKYGMVCFSLLKTEWLNLKKGIKYANEFLVFKTLCALFIARICQSNKAHIAYPVAIKGVKELKFSAQLNTAILPLTIDEDDSFKDLYQKTLAYTKSLRAASDIRYTEYPIYDVLAQTDGLQPNVSFTQAHMRNKTFEFEDCKLEANNRFNHDMAAEIILEYQSTDNGFNFRLRYRRTLFEDQQMVDMSEQFQQLLYQCLQNPDQKLSEIPYLTDAQHETIVRKFNDTEHPEPKITTLHETISKKAQEIPKLIALIDQYNQYSYREMDELATKMALIIQAKYQEVFGTPMPKESLIGICTHRHIDTVVVLLAVLKAGGAYVPMDNDYPQDRLEYIILDSGLSLILTEEDIGERFTHLSIATLTISELKQGNSGNCSTLPAVSPNQLAYVIYTSGTTGKPKGTMLTHRGIVNMAHSARHHLYQNLKPHATCMHFAALVFDPHAFEIFGALFAGNKLVVASQEAREDTKILLDLIEQHEVNFAPLPPALLKLKIDFPKSLRDIALGGEATPLEVLNHYANQNYSIYNLYGPTEASVWVSFNRYHYNGAKNIGRPMNNTKLYILDPKLKPLPIGVFGELYIAGLGLARGYLNLPKLTEDHFIDNPFTDEEDYTKLYKTGDLVRRLSNGEIEYIGRDDFQVKIRGYRIELSEIETILNQITGIDQSAVITHGIETLRLVAYYVSKKDIDKTKIYAALNQHLPNYMVPSALMKIDTLPKTINDKLDIQALPEPVFNEQLDYEAPVTDSEMTCCHIWSSFLDLDKIGTKDNFFHLGGNSIMAIQICNRLSDVWNIPVSVVMFSRFPTIQAFCQQLQQQNTPVTQITTYHQDHAPLSFAQSRLWFIESLLEGSSVYHIPILLELDKTASISSIELSLQALIKRHQALRTQIHQDENGAPYQQVINDIVDIKIHETKTSHQNLDPTIYQLINEPFDLINGKPIRVNLIKNEAEQYLLINIHHIAFDGWSKGIFLEELNTYYQHFSTGASVSPLDLPVQYTDYSIWQNEILNQKQAELTLFWKNKLSGYELLDLPTDFVRPLQFDYQGENFWFTIDSSLSKNLKNLAKTLNVSLHALLLSSCTILLSCYTNQRDIIIGTPVANRPYPQLEHLIGFFVNSLVLRNQCDPSLSCASFIKAVFENTMDSQAHQDMPFEQLINHLDVPRDSSRNPLFQIMFILEEQQKSPANWFNLKQLDSFNAAKFDLTLFFEDCGDAIKVAFNYCAALFKQETIQRMQQHFMQILMQIVKNPQMNIAQINILSQEEREQILYLWNDTKQQSSLESNLHKAITSIAQKYPQAIALTDDKGDMTYAELDNLSSIQAKYIRAHYTEITKQNLPHEALIGLCTHRHKEMIVAMLAILKAGGAYVPMDIAYPQDRIEYIVNNSNMALVITESDIVSRFEHLPITIISIHELKNQLINDVTTILPQVGSEHLAYVIYTSGTTGRPKGTMLEHKGVLNMVQSSQQLIHQGLSTNTTVLQFASIVFDAHVYETYLALLSGYRLVIAPQQAREDLDELLELIETYKINTGLLPPALLKLKPELPNSLKCIAVGGESTPLDVLEYYTNKGVDIYNLYGPTEASVWVSMNHYKNNGAQNIGRPMGNTKLYVLNEFMLPVPVGVVGELFIAGINLSRGYIGLSELTSQAFITNPFESDSNYQSLYKTGDLVRWQADGSIEYIGRNDHQVKIRGHRIELHEIEKALNQLSFIKQSAVIVHGSDIKHLVAYCVVNAQVNSKDIQGKLAESLPKYMVPNVIMMIESLPMTINGKLDTKLLPKPVFNHSQKIDEKPANELEQKCCDVWSSLLKIEKIGVHNNFYSLGGTSIIAIQICNQLSKKLNSKISVASFTNHPTIRGFCNHLIESKNSTAIDTIISHQRLENSLSFSQSRLWFIEMLANKQSAYHVPILLHLNYKIDFTLLKQSILSVMERHKVLRSVILEDAKGMPYQQVKPAKLKIKELSIRAEQWNESIRQLIATPFNLSEELPIKVTLLHHNEKTFCLINIHHIAFDGWSTNIFLDELNQFYQYFSKKMPLNLPALNLQYSDYAIWEKESLAKRLDTLLSFWQKQLKNYEPLNLPTDFKRPNEFDYQGANLDFSINQELTYKIRHLAKSLGVTLQAVIFSAFNLLLSRYSNQKDIIVGIPVANRPHAELEGLIGFFVNSLVLRNQCLDDISVNQFIKSVFNNINDCQEHQDMPFEQLVKHLNIPRDSEVNPLFQVMFSFDQGQEKHQDWFSLETINQYDAAKFDLTAVFEDQMDTITGGFNYATALFKPETIKRISQHLQEILKQMVTKENVTLKEISVLTPAEYQWSIYHLNLTTAKEPDYYSLHAGISIQAQKTPERVALIDQQKSYTYAEIDHLSSAQARLIRTHYKAFRQHEMPQETLIGLCTDRHAKMIIAMLAILKAGGAYVPMDKSYPKDRLEYIVQDSKMPLVITEDFMAECFASLPIAIITIHQLETERLKNTIKSSKLPQVKADQLAYVIYTSGTAGKPKGTLISHRGVMNMVSSTQQYIYQNLSPKATVLQFSPIVFDAHVLEIYSALLSSYSLVVASQNAREDIDELLLIIKTQQVDVGFLPPALLTLKPKLPASMTHIIIGGEVPSLEVLNHYQADSRQLFNLYGPTEASVWVSMNHYKNNGAQNIGRSKNNMKLYVLNEYLQPVPIGVIGELYLSGIGLAKGYLNQVNLTKETFIHNPFESHPDYQLMYKTGDLVRMQPNGDLEYSGRNDHQVKIRGHRIELNEIEHAINSIEGVDQSVVVIHEISEPKIIAYFVSASRVASSFIQKEISQLLPAYMLPKAMIQMEKLPITMNGKIDTRALPRPDFSNKNPADKKQPETLLEQKIYAAWQMILGFEVIGLEDSFFDLGGDSIAIIRLISELRRIGLHVNVKDIYAHHTIRSFVEFIASKDSSIEDILTEQGILTGSFNLLPIQEWFFDENFAQPQHWNQAFLIKVPPLDVYKLQACIDQLVIHHDMLRTTFSKDISGKYQQTMHAHIHQPKLKICHREALAENDLQALLTSWQNHFNYEEGALWQFGYIDGYEDGSARIFCTFHHLIIDAVSWRILTQDLKLLYEEKPLGLKGTSLRQWQNHLNNMQDTAISQTDFWLQQTVCPVDYMRDLANSKTSHTHIEIRSIKETYSLLSLCEQLNLGLNELMLAALVQVLSAWTGHQSHNLLLESHGRDVGNEVMDLGGTVGWFTSMYPMKFDFFADQLEYIKNIQHIFQSIPDNGLMYGVLKYLHKGSVDHHPSSVMFNYLGQFNSTEAEWAMVAENAGETLSKKNMFSNALSFNALISDYQLSYSLNGYLNPTDLSRFNNELLKSMHQLAQKLKQNMPIKPFNLIKPLNEYQAGLPSIWMIHPGGYDSDVYEPIAEELNGQVNCFGIDSYNLNNEQQIEELTALADYYLNEMKKHPAFDAKQLHILGWSTGGVIGAQICVKLEQNAVQNINLYLLDTLYLSQQNIGFDDHQLKNMLQQLEKQSMTPDQSYRVIRSSSSGTKISSAAISQPLLQSKAILFKALEKHASISAPEAERFLNITDNNLSAICHNLEVINLNCNHYSILDHKQLIIDKIMNLIEV